MTGNIDTDLGRLFISEDHATEDTSIVPAPALKEQEGSVKDPGHRAENSALKEKMVKMAEASEDGDSSDPALSYALRVQELLPKLPQVGSAKDKRKEHYKTIRAWNEDGVKLDMILKKVKRLDNQVAPMFADLFFLLKRYNQEITEISLFKVSLVQARAGEDEPRFIEKIIDLLELADKELKSVKQWWMIEGGDDRLEGRSPEWISREITTANKLLSELMGLVLRLERFREFRSVSEPRAEDVVMLEKTLAETEAELLKIEVKMHPLLFKVKNGKFIAVVTAMGHAADCIESIEL
ncbi:hypothetical protein MLD38_039959 [Melastoma candidum]|nr:hypothetical protein MLD38_039959 [Melastoma candidum]